MARAVAPGNVRVSIEHCAAAAARAELQDPVGWADVLAQRDRATDLLLERVSDGRSPRRASYFSWPKERGGHRRMLVLDPFDELLYRAALHPAVLGLAALVRSAADEVLSARIRWAKGGWTLEPYGRAIKERGRRAQELLDRPSSRWMSVIDVRDYFPCVSESLVEEMLVSSGLPRQHVAFICRWLRRAYQQAATQGLPIGPQSSSVIGNALLSPLDHSLRAASIPFLRYMDDTWAFVSSEDEGWDLIDRYRHGVQRLGFELNDDKTTVCTGPTARAVVSRRSIDYAEDDIREGGEGGRAAAESLFQVACDSPVDQRSELRYSLRSLGALGDPVPLAAIFDNPEIIRVAPSQVIKYFGEMVKVKKARRRIREWAEAEIVLPLAGEGDQIRRYVAAVTASRLKLSKDAGSGLFDKVCCASDLPTPVRVWAVEAWAKSQAFKRGRVIEALEATDDLCVRRALVSSLRQEAARARVELDKAQAFDRELAVTVSWVKGR